MYNNADIKIRHSEVKRVHFDFEHEHFGSPRAPLLPLNIAFVIIFLIESLNIRTEVWVNLLRLL